MERPQDVPPIVARFVVRLGATLVHSAQAPPDPIPVPLLSGGEPDVVAVADPRSPVAGQLEELLAVLGGDAHRVLESLSRRERSAAARLEGPAPPDQPDERSTLP